MKGHIIFLYIVCIISICILLIYNSIYKNKTIYLVWRNLINKSNSNGFGDKLRSAIATYQFSRENNIRFVLDGTDDICGKFLKNITTYDYFLIKNKKVEHIECPNNSESCDFGSKINKKLNKSSVIFISTNKCPNNDDCISYKKNILSNDDKLFAKYICEPRNFLKEEIENKLKTLPKNYGIQHFRFNDSVFDNDIDVNDSKFISFYNILESTYKPTDVLLSNSLNFKRYAKNKLNIKTVDCDGKLCKIEHIGKSTDYESVKSSFIEFYIISKAKYIKTKSDYDWVSNFIKWPSLIYDVPLEIHKNVSYS